LPFSFLPTNGVGSWAKAEFKVSAPKIIKIDIAAYLSMRNILDAGLTTVLYQQKRNYSIGVISSRWRAKGSRTISAPSASLQLTKKHDQGQSHHRYDQSIKPERNPHKQQQQNDCQKVEWNDRHKSEHGQWVLGTPGLRITQSLHLRFYRRQLKLQG
jgi:hypothetical protein